MSQEACIVGDVSYHSFQGILVDEKEKESIIKDLGVHNKVMLLRNHGAVCCGETVEEAFFYAYNLVLACDTQVRNFTSQSFRNLVMSRDMCSSLR